MKNIGRVFIPVLFTTLIVSACGKEEEKGPEQSVVRPVKMMVILAGEGGAVRRFPGVVRASQRVDMAFQVSGPLIELPADEGQEVKQGDLLGRIDPRDFEVDLRNVKGQLAQAKASLRAMRQARPEDIRRLESVVSKAEAGLTLAKADYDRVIRIRDQDPGAVSQGMIDQAREKRDRAEAELRNAKEELRIGKIGARPEDIQAKEAEIRSLGAKVDAAKDQLSYTFLKAPFNGVIATRHVENFQEVRAKQPIVTLDDLSDVEILVDVPEIFMATVREDAGSAEAEFAGAPGKRYPLVLKEFSTRADPKTQTYRVVLTMPIPKDIRVLPGMTATVIATEGSITGSGIAIPAIAVFADEAGKSHVWVVDPEKMTARRRPVTTGSLTGKDAIEITEGLKPGETIATAGVGQLREGMQVRRYEP